MTAAYDTDDTSRPHRFDAGRLVEAMPVETYDRAHYPNHTDEEIADELRLWPQIRYLLATNGDLDAFDASLE